MTEVLLKLNEAIRTARQSCKADGDKWLLFHYLEGKALEIGEEVNPLPPPPLPERPRPYRLREDQGIAKARRT